MQNIIWFIPILGTLNIILPQVDEQSREQYFMLTYTRNAWLNAIGKWRATMGYLTSIWRGVLTRNFRRVASWVTGRVIIGSVRLELGVNLRWDSLYDTTTLGGKRESWKSSVLITHAWAPGVALPWWSRATGDVSCWMDWGGRLQVHPIFSDGSFYIAPATPVWQRACFSLHKYEYLAAPIGQSLSYPIIALSSFMKLNDYRRFHIIRLFHSILKTKPPQYLSDLCIFMSNISVR